MADGAGGGSPIGVAFGVPSEPAAAGAPTACRPKRRKLPSCAPICAQIPAIYFCIHNTKLPKRIHKISIWFRSSIIPVKSRVAVPSASV